jgi:nitrite reductase (NADH) small subunit
MSWVDICAHSELPVDRGVCALVGKQPVALFRVGSGEVFALSNIDPFSGASVLSRGLVGSRRDADGFDIPKVASPMYKQSFELRTGVCVDDPAVSISTFAVSVVDDRVLVSSEILA